jgi:hypothetical protein
MAKHIREFHTCDICGAEIETPYRGGENGTYSLTFSADFAVAGFTTEWKELCVGCNGWLGRMVDDLQQHSKEMRRASLGESE